MSLLSHLCGSKGYGICADEAAAKQGAKTMQICCAELSLPVLSSDRERKYIETMGFYACSLPTFCHDTESRPSETSPPAGAKNKRFKRMCLRRVTFCVRQKVTKERTKGEPLTMGFPLWNPLPYDKKVFATERPRPARP